MNELLMFEDEAEREKLERCTRVRVKRLEMGKWVYAPVAYDPGTLETMEQLHEIFGGGDYMIEARDADNAFLKNVRLQLPGKPKPLAPEPEAAPAPVAAPVPQAAPGLTGMEMLMQFMMAQMQQTTQVLTAVLTRGDSSSDKFIARSQALEDRARAEQSEFLKTLLERAHTVAAAQPAGGGSQESFMAGIEFAQGLFSELANKQPSENPADFMSSINQFVQGLGAIGREVAATGTPAGGGTNGAGGN